MIQTIQISDEQKKKIIDLNENHFNDLKSKDISPASLTKTISAFSNAVGGELYIGIDEVEVNGVHQESGVVLLMKKKQMGTFKFSNNYFLLETAIHILFYQIKILLV